MIKRADIFFIVSAVIAFIFSNYLWFGVQNAKAGFFVFLWVPSNMILALYFQHLHRSQSRQEN